MNQINHGDFRAWYVNNITSKIIIISVAVIRAHVNRNTINKK